MAKPRLEVVVVRDSDASTELYYFLDGKPLTEFDVEEYHIDPGAGYDWEDWVDSRADEIATASKAAAEKLWELAVVDWDYVDGVPDDPETELRKAVRAYRDLYRKQAQCPHPQEKRAAYMVSANKCSECQKVIPVPEGEQSLYAIVLAEIAAKQAKCKHYKKYRVPRYPWQVEMAKTNPHYRRDLIEMKCGQCDKPIGKGE